ncbi:hypothetical protein HDU98_000723, partial [Podochytrium sp. JEL0797]
CAPYGQWPSNDLHPGEPSVASKGINAMEQEHANLGNNGIALTDSATKVAASEPETAVTAKEPKWIFPERVGTDLTEEMQEAFKLVAVGKNIFLTGCAGEFLGDLMVDR